MSLRNASFKFIQRCAIASALAILNTALILPVSAQSTDDTVYQALGGQPGIRKIVDDFIPIVLSDARIKAGFEGVDLKRFANMLAEQFCELSGGPCKYSGRAMNEAHEDLKLTNAKFNAITEDLQLALDKNAIPFSIQNKLIAKLAPMQHEIVTK